MHIGRFKSSQNFLDINLQTNNSNLSLSVTFFGTLRVLQEGKPKTENIGSYFRHHWVWKYPQFDKKCIMQLS